MLAKLIGCLFLSVTILAAGPAAAAPAKPETKPETKPSAKAAQAAKAQAVETRNRLLISVEAMASLQTAVKGQAWQWRLLNNWSRANARQEKNPHDAPGLALSALLNQIQDSEVGTKLGRLAVGCVLKVAHAGQVQEVSPHSVRAPQADPMAGSQGTSPYTLLANAAGKSWRVQRITPNGVVVEGSGPPLTDSFKAGDPYFLVSDDLDQANQWVSITALALDWGREFFSPEERKLVAGWLVAQAKAFADRDGGCFDRASTRLLHLTVLAGLAAKGLDPGAEALAARAHQKLWIERMLPCLDNLGQGGAWFGGTGAGAEAGYNLLQSLAAFDSVMGQKYWSKSPWLADRLSYLLQAWQPGVLVSPRGGFRLLGPDGDRLLDPQDAFDLTRAQVLYLLRYRPDDPAAGNAWVLMLDRQTPRVLSDHLLFEEMLAFQPDPVLAPLSTAPLQYLAPATGRAFSRSDWSDRGTWLSFLCGPHFAETQHLDAGGLIINRQGPLLPPGGAYDGPNTPHALNYGIRSLAQNTLVIYDPQEYSWYDLGEGPQRKGFYSNDGGQRSFAQFDAQGNPIAQAPWTASGLETGPAPWSGLKQLYQAANISAMMAMPRFAYLRGNLTPAYQGSTAKARRVVRHLFHLRPGGTDDADAVEAVVVVDDVALNQERATVRFVLHSAEKPELAATLPSVGPGRWRGKADHLVISTPTSRLAVYSLPAMAATLSLYGEVGVADSWVGDRNWPPRPPAVNPAPWRAEFEAAGVRGKARPMLHVLLPADKNAPAPPRLEVLATGDPEVAGVVLHDPAYPRVIAVRLGEPDAKAGVGYAFPAGNSRHLIAGLWPEQAYAIQVKNDKLTLAPGQGPGRVLTSSRSGALSFVLAPEEGD